MENFYEKYNYKVSSPELDNSIGPDLNIFVVTDKDGRRRYLDFSKLQHVIITGSTGCGKTSFIMSCMSEIAEINTPEQVKFLVFDSVQVNYTFANNNKYFFLPLQTDFDYLTVAMHLFSVEGNNRLKMLQSKGVKNIDAYNKTSKAKLSHMFFIIDDCYQLVESKETVERLFDLMQIGSYTGIHCILCSSSAFVSNKLNNIKAFIPNRIMFNQLLSSNLESSLKSPGEMIVKTIDDTFRCDCNYIEFQEVLRTFRNYREQN